MAKFTFAFRVGKPESRYSTTCWWPRSSARSRHVLRKKFFSYTLSSNCGTSNLTMFRCPLWAAKWRAVFLYCAKWRIHRMTYKRNWNTYYHELRYVWAAFTFVRILQGTWDRYVERLSQSCTCCMKEAVQLNGLTAWPLNTGCAKPSSSVDMQSL